MQEVTFEEALDQILARDSTYHRDAYLFVREALVFTQKLVGRGQGGRERHVSGQQLLDGIRQFAIKEYGPMVLTVLEEWGVRHCRDFGNLVFIMIEARLLRKTDTDSRSDFENGYDFDEAFRKPFLPAGTQPKRRPAQRIGRS